MQESELLRRVREICATLDGVTEAEAWNHPVFKANGKTFLAFEHKDGKPVLAFLLPADDVEILRKDKRFLPTAYGGGRWVSMWLTGRTPWRLVAELARRSRRLIRDKR